MLLGYAICLSIGHYNPDPKPNLTLLLMSNFIPLFTTVHSVLKICS